MFLWACSVPWRMKCYCKSCAQVTGTGQPSRHATLHICQQLLFHVGKREESDAPGVLWELRELMKNKARGRGTPAYLKNRWKLILNKKTNQKQKTKTESKCYRCVNEWLGREWGKACVYIAELVIRDSCSRPDFATDSSSRVRPTSVLTSE